MANKCEDCKASQVNPDGSLCYIYGPLGCWELAQQIERVGLEAARKILDAIAKKTSGN